MEFPFKGDVIQLALNVGLVLGYNVQSVSLYSLDWYRVINHYQCSNSKFNRKVKLSTLEIQNCHPARAQY
jgi:hypothetical protein